MDEQCKVMEKQCCPCCGLELPDYFFNRSWLLELEVLLSRTDDPLLTVIENRSLAELRSIYLHLMRRNGHV